MALKKEINIFFVLKSNSVLFLAVVHRARSTGHALTHTLNTLHAFSTLTRRTAALQLVSSCEPNSSKVCSAVWLMSRALGSTGCVCTIPHTGSRPVLQHSTQCTSAAHLRLLTQILILFNLHIQLVL